MAWGRGTASQGLDDLCTRLKGNDPNLASLTILKHRKFDTTEVQKLCNSLVSNTVLKELYASNHPLTAEAAALIGGLLSQNRTLTALCIGDGNFGDAGVSALSAGLLKCSLNSLDLENKNITASGAQALSQVLAENGSLKRLNIARNPMGDTGALSLSKLEWPHLAHLDLRACGFGADSASYLAAAFERPPGCLSSLDLSDNDLGPGAGPDLGRILQRSSTLTELCLRGCSLGDAGVSGLAGGLAAQSGLTSLNLSFNQFGNIGGVALASALAGNTSLLRLDLGSNSELSAEAILRIAAAINGSGAGSQLLSLDLSAAKLQGEEGAEALAALSSSKLKQLCLLGTGCGSEGAKRLVGCLEDGGFAALQELSVSACNLDLDAGMGPLLTVLGAGFAKSLKVLECGANPACQEERMADMVLALRESRPQLHVHWNAGDEAGNVEQAAGSGIPSGEA